MSRSARTSVAALAAAAALALTLGAAAAHAALLTPPPAPAPPVAPVAAALTADPAGPVVGTVVLIHAGGWAGHDAQAQRQLMDRPGALLLQRGWRVVSIDYHEGADGLQDVLDAVGAELARGTSTGPLCLYGESAGWHLALVAAARLRAIDCVIAIGAPTDLALYQQQAATNPDGRVKLVATQSMRYFGTTPAQLAPWNPVTLAPATRADILLLHERDDPIVSALHAQRVQAARLTTQIVELDPGDPADPATTFVHATASSLGRAEYAAAIAAFADRAVGFRRVERTAARTGCARANRSLREVGLPVLRNALHCLAHRALRAHRSPAHGWRRTVIATHGEITAARVWGLLEQSTNGRRALLAAALHRAAVIVRARQRSQITVRATAPRTSIRSHRHRGL